MSDPQNPLDRFRSYSYHHILVACDGTDTAEALAQESEITLFDHERAKEKYCPQQILNGAGNYIVLINGTSDAQYTIKSVKWSTSIIPAQGINGVNQTTSMATDGELHIEEPLGVNFLNLLNEVTKRLGTDPNGVVFLLKTIFVGERDDGKTETITNIQPLLLFFYDISALFDITGAEYTISFAGIANGAARLQQCSTISDGFAFTIDNRGKKTLRELIEVDLPKQLNAFYQKRKQELIAAAAGVTNISYDEEFMDVNYTFSLHPDYYNYVVDTCPASRQNKGTDDPTYTLKGETMSIDDFLDLLMKSSTEVINQEEAGAKERYMHKITSTLHTGPDHYTVEYQIHRYKASVIPVEQMFTFTPGEGQGIIFDYIFTGRNVDIQTFDIKMQLGMVFFQTLNVSSSIPADARDVTTHTTPNVPIAGQGTLNGTGDQKEGGACGKKKRKKPLFLGESIRDSSTRNNRSPNLTANYNSLIAKHAAVEMLQARMVIRGNPQLMADTTPMPSVFRYMGDLTKAGKNEKPPVINTGTPGARNYFEAIHRLPAYVKVNVMMPTRSLAYNPSSLYSNDYAQNFWYPGWYLLLAINNVFDDGEFTQELEMNSIPVDSSQQNLSKTDPRAGATGKGSGNISSAENVDELTVKDFNERKKSNDYIPGQL